MIADYSGGFRFSGHGYYDRGLEGADTNVVSGGTNNLLKVLEGLGHKAFLNSGTLLGLVRDKNLIPYDDDIDLAVVLKSRGELYAAQEFCALTEQLNEKGIDCTLRVGNNAMIKLPDLDGFEVDLFSAYDTSTYYHVSQKLRTESLCVVLEMNLMRSRSRFALCLMSIVRVFCALADLSAMFLRSIIGSKSDPM